MTKEGPDDLEAVRAVVAALQPFEPKDKERILRWSREKLGLSSTEIQEKPAFKMQAEAELRASSTPGKRPDIKTFIDSKNPQSDAQYATAVAYYYRFESPEEHRKGTITSTDLQDACRMSGRTRFKNPNQTLNNAVALGYLDRGADRGTFAVNTVGENLIAMTLPEGGGSNAKAVAKRKTRR